MVDLNLTAAFELAHEAAVLMKEQGGGKIINIASLYSFLGGQGSPAYAATKHGIVGLHQGLLRRAGPAQHPGQRDRTRLLRDLHHRRDPLRPGGEPAGARPRAGSPLGRAGDLMGAVVFLASRASDYVNGHVLTVDGGYLVR